MSSVAAQLQLFQLQLWRYEVPIVFAVGVAGNLINVITFGHSTLRKNMCSWYFISLSLAHLFLLIFSCLTRVISVTTGFDLSARSLAFCKFRGYATDNSITLARHFLCLIAIDRWLVTSAHTRIRNQSSARITRRLIVGSIIFWSVFHIHVPIQYGIGVLGCTPPLGSTYELFYSMYNIVGSLIPMFIMSLFTVMAVRNLTLRTRNQVQPLRNTTATSHTIPNTASTTPSTASSQQSRREMQLIRLSVLQVVVFIILNAIRAIFPLYSFLLNSRGNPTPDDRNMSLFLSGLGTNLLFTYTATTFILYTLASKTFRSECVAIFKKLIRSAKQRVQAIL